MKELKSAIVVYHVFIITLSIQAKKISEVIEDDYISIFILARYQISVKHDVNISASESARRRDMLSTVFVFLWRHSTRFRPIGISEINHRDMGREKAGQFVQSTAGT